MLKAVAKAFKRHLYSLDKLGMLAGCQAALSLGAPDGRGVGTSIGQGEG